MSGCRRPKKKWGCRGRARGRWISPWGSRTCRNIDAMLKARFRTKVLVPVIVVMALLVAITVTVVSRRITQQFLTEARNNLATANAVFLNSQKIRARDFTLRFRGLTD